MIFAPLMNSGVAYFHTIIWYFIIKKICSKILNINILQCHNLFVRYSIKYSWSLWSFGLLNDDYMLSKRRDSQRNCYTLTSTWLPIEMMQRKQEYVNCDITSVFNWLSISKFCSKHRSISFFRTNNYCDWIWNPI